MFEPIPAARRHGHVGVQAEALEPGTAGGRNAGGGSRAEPTQRLARAGAEADTLLKGRGDGLREQVFVEVVARGKQAETVATYLTKGRPVGRRGRLQLDQWATEAGERRPSPRRGARAAGPSCRTCPGPSPRRPRHR